MTSKRSIYSSMIMFLLVTVCLLAFQNCGQDFQAVENQPSLSYASTQACFANTNIDSCIYPKSAVAQAGAAVDAGAAGEYQTLGVQLAELDNSGYLTSTSFVVGSNSGRAQKISSAWKYSFNNNTNKLAQVSAYYYLTDFKNHFKSRTGLFHAENRNIKVTVDSGFAGWSIPPIKEINLQIDDEKIPMALDAGIVVNLLAHANAYYATSGSSSTNISTHSQTCTNKKGARIPNTCCISNQGCGPAILAGQADYMTAVYFSNSASTSIGESWASQIEGASACTVSRDVSKNSGLRLAAAYSACSGIGSNGNIFSMGALYASIWWEARKKFSDKDDFDLFFLKHVELIQGDDTFTTIKTKILNLDQAQFSSKYTAAMQAEFTQRGL